MFISNQVRDKIVDSIFGVVTVAFGLLVAGRALNSRFAIETVSRWPVVGPITDSVRAAINEAAYDPRGAVA